MTDNSEEEQSIYSEEDSDNDYHSEYHEDYYDENLYCNYCLDRNTDSRYKIHPKLTVEMCSNKEKKEVYFIIITTYKCINCKQKVQKRQYNVIPKSFNDFTYFYNLNVKSN